MLDKSYYKNPHTVNNCIASPLASSGIQETAIMHSNQTIIKAAHKNLDDIASLRKRGEHALRVRDMELYGIILWAIRQPEPMAAFDRALGGAA